MKSAVGTLAALLPWAFASAVAAAPIDDAVFMDVDAAARRAITENRSAGLVVGVLRDGELVFARGYGQADLESGAAATTDTVFRIASVTKQFTAAAVLRLADQGKLQLDDPLSRYLPDFPRGDDITLRQLLNHTSGIKDVTAIPRFVTEGIRVGYDSDGYVRAIGGMQPLLDFEPGAGWRYSNAGYILMGVVVEKVSGRTFADFLQSSFFQPLGMRRTALDTGAELVDNRARGYEATLDAAAPFRLPQPLAMTAVAGAGGLRSTVGDLALWQRALFGGKVLKPESLKLMLTPGRLKDGRPTGAARSAPPATSSGQAAPQVDYGMGFHLVRTGGMSVVGHTGDMFGFESEFDLWPDQGVGLIVLSNTQAVPGKPDLTETFRGLVAARLSGGQ